RRTDGQTDVRHAKGNGFVRCSDIRRESRDLQPLQNLLPVSGFRLRRIRAGYRDHEIGEVAGGCCACMYQLSCSARTLSSSSSIEESLPLRMISCAEVSRS